LRGTGVHARADYGTLPGNLVVVAPSCITPRGCHLAPPRECVRIKGLTNLMSRRCLRLIDRKAGMGIDLTRLCETDMPDFAGRHPSGYRAHHEIAPSTGPFRSKPDSKSVVPGPQAGNNKDRGPGTHPHRTPGSPSSSQRTGVATRYVAEWIEFVYLSRGPHDTQHLSSCLVTSASNTSCFPWSRSGQ
jgi:hypothetical protein